MDQGNQLFTLALGLVPPWMVDEVQFTAEEKRVQRESAVLLPRQALCGEWAAASSAVMSAVHRHSVLTILVLAVLSGCASYHPRVLVPSVTAAAFQARSLDNPKLRTFLAHYGCPPKHWPKRHWNLDDLALVAL